MSGVKLNGYVGIQFGADGDVNVEDMRISNSAIGCFFGANSYGIVDIEGGNSDDDEAYHNDIKNCFQGIRAAGGSIDLLQQIWRKWRI